MEDRRPAALPGVNFVPYPAGGAEVRAAQEKARILVDSGVTYANCPPGRVPWLVALRPFHLDAELLGRIERMGASTFAFLDAMQKLYAEGNPTVRRHLDDNVPHDLRGLQLDRRIITFRLDIGLQNGHPKVTEIEEIYGNVGKMDAMQRAYGVNNDALFRHFAAEQLTHIYADDSLPTYLSELGLLQRRLAESFGLEVGIRNFSEFPTDQTGVIWRFCRTRDFEQYPPQLRNTIIRARCRFINPLFHGYGIKSALALPFHPKLATEFKRLMGPESYGVIRKGFTRSRLLGPRTPPEVWAEIAGGHRTNVLKIVDCPGGPEYTWGSRGVYFGDRSATRWGNVMEAAKRGRIPGESRFRNVRYMASELVEGDRFDLPFLHPASDATALMTRARIRMTPNFFRDGGDVRLMAGHASFVNTSRKIHLGSHAVCAPLDWEHQRADSPSVPG